MTRKPTYGDLKQRVKELQKAVADLGKSEEDYRSMIEHTNDMIAITNFDLKPTYTYISPSIKEIMGYEPEKLIGRSVFEFIHPADKKKLLPLLKKYLTLKAKIAFTKKDLDFAETIEYRFKDKSGDWHYLQSTGNLIGNKMLFISRDITENKKIEEKLKTSEEVFRTLTENTPIGIYYSDFSGKFIYGNKKAEEIVGYKSEELIGKNFLKLKLLQAKDIPKAAKLLALNKLGRATGPDEFILNRKDGFKVVVEINTEIITIGGKKVVLGMVQDITNRKTAAEALRESEERYRKLISEMINGFALHEIILDETGRPCDYRFLEVNSSFEGMTGLDAADIVGKTVLDVMPSLEPFWIDTYGKVALTGKPARFEHFSNPLKRYYEVLTYSPQKGQFATVFTDITERKKAEEEKTLLESQLQRAQKMEALGTLAGGVAHDLNNILSGIVSYPDLLLMQLPEDSLLRKPILTMQESGLKAAAIVQDLLTLARREVATMEVVDLNEIVTEYLKSPELEKLRLFHPHVAIKPDLKGDLLNISGSRAHLTKTVMNLISNAAEAMKEGGTISLSTENRYIDRPIRGYDQVEEGDYVILSVSDTGVGIPAEDIDRIFEPFYTKKKIGRSGTGLGMTVVWGTVKDHKGYIDVQSTEGKGTTFTLYFPATREGRAKGKLLLSIKEYRGKGESILVVDDVKEQRDIASTILSGLGYSVTTVSSGEEAVEYLKARTADLIVLDMIMDPGIDGLDTYREILKIHPHQKAIIASGFSETERVKEVKNLGAGQYIRKPYTMEKIGVAIRDELEK
jgi:PAS domain S-box-containing protein